MESTGVSAIEVGHRIQHLDNFGTVRFKGHVPPAKGEWLGVEWDDPSRGKHDGSKDGVQYFSTKHPTSGSFVRAEKVITGTLFLQAVQERYGLVEGESAGVIEEDMFVVGKSRGQTTKVEVVGAKSVNQAQSQLDEQEEFVLRECQIRSSEPGDVIKKTCPLIRFLDLGKNLLPSWDEVAKITQHFENMSILNLSDNRLPMPTDGSALAHAFGHLRVLTMNRVDYDWDQILQCACMWPVIEQVHLCYNRITTVTDPLPKLHDLSLVNLEGNPLQGWEQVLQLGNLSRLDVLILNNTGLESIYFPDCEHGQKSQLFPTMRELSVNENKIDKWDSITELNKLQKINNFKFRHNPISKTDLDTSEETIRYHVIARVPGLRLLNRSDVTPEEKKGAELDYLKMYGTDWKKAGGNQDPEKNKPSAEFTQAHPRYQQLVDYYGAPEDSELVKQTTALKSNLLNVTITCDLSSKPDVTKKLPGSMTVQKLKALTLRLFGGDPTTQTLTYSSPQVEGQEFELDHDLREISFYAIENGDTVHVKWT